jgi:hypothetical protein
MMSVMRSAQRVFYCITQDNTPVDGGQALLDAKAEIGGSCAGAGACDFSAASVYNHLF